MDLADSDHLSAICLVYFIVHNLDSIKEIGVPDHPVLIRLLLQVDRHIIDTYFASFTVASVSKVPVQRLRDDVIDIPMLAKSDTPLSSPT